MAPGGLAKHFAPGLRSLKAVWPPMLAVQVALIAVVAGYFNNAAIHSALESAADFKDRTGLIFVLASGFFAGGILPEIAKAATGRIPRFDRAWLSLTLYTGAVYTFVTALVYFMFQFQVVLFGAGNDIGTVAKKVAFDQLLFSPFLSIPLGVGLFKWRLTGFAFSGWKQVLVPANYVKNVFPALIMCWSFWGPVACAMYCLPPRIIFIVSAFCQAAWSLLFVFMVNHDESPVEAAPPE